MAAVPTASLASVGGGPNRAQIQLVEVAPPKLGRLHVAIQVVVTATNVLPPSQDLRMMNANGSAPLGVDLFACMMKIASVPALC